MYADPYWCGVCDVTFDSEKASYEHDVSYEHHKQYDRTQRMNGHPTIHYCSVCDRGGISSFKTWLSHCHGKLHRKAMEKFQEFYEMHRESSDKSRARTESKSSSSSKLGKRTSEKPKLSYIEGTNEKNKNDNDSKRFISEHDKLSSTSGVSSKTEKTEMAHPDAIPASTLDTTTSSSSKNGGMMLNILETIETNPPPPPPISNLDNLELYRRKPKEERCQKQTLKNKRKVNQPRELSKKKRITKSPSRSVTQLTITPPVNQQNVSPRPETHAETGTLGDLKRMQDALAISQELESLTLKQSELEAQLHTIQNQLDEVKTKRRELKLRRTALLRGLVRSESDEDNDNIVPASNPAQMNQPFRVSSFGMPENAVTASSYTPMNSSTPFPNAPSHLSQHWSNAGPPPISSSDIQQSHGPFTSSSLSFPRAVSSGFVAQPSASFLPTGQMNNLMASRDQTQNPCVTHLPPSSIFVAPIQSNNPASEITVQNSSASTNPLPVPTSIPQPSSSATSTAARVDLERLALIRQALQSPDSWQFTFEDVDRMLQQTAARVNAKQSTQLVDSVPPITGMPPATLPEPVSVALPNTGSSITSGSLMSKPSINIKGEPDFHIKPPVPVPHTGDLSIAKPVNSLEVLKPSTDSSSSFDSSEDDQVVRQNPVHKIKRLVKPDPSQPVSSAPVDNSNSPIHQNTQPTVPGGLKDLVKYGEFHAFDGQTTAVIDMLVHHSSWNLFVGGQNGTVGQFDLKTHTCIRRMAPRDASVTRMVLDPLGRSLFVGYYDNYLAEFNIATGSLLFEKYFAQRIEALAVPPVRDVSFLYLGMSNGDILRHDINSRSVIVLYDRSLDQMNQSLDTKSSAGISSLAVVQSGTRLLLIVGDQERCLTVRAANDGSAVLCIRSAPHKGPPQGIARLPFGTLFCAYSERAVRIHNWKTGTGVMTLQTQKVTSSSVTERYMALGDSEGAIRVHKLQHNGLPQSRPMKVYFAATRAAITSLIGYGEVLIAGGLDGSVTTIWVNEPAKNHVCLYGPFGHNCGIGFDSREDLIKHVLDTHFIFGGNKSIMCRWGAGRCRVRFSDTKSIKAISDHLLTHMPD